MDIDKDGFIDKFDIETFINRYYIRRQVNGEHSTLDWVKTVIILISIYNFKNTETTQVYDEKNIFPTKEFSKAEMKQLNVLIKQASTDKKLSFYDMFILLDIDSKIKSII